MLSIPKTMKSTRNNPATLESVRIVFKALDEKKAEDIRVLNVSEQSSITDYLVIATGTSEPHLRALRVELEKALDAAKVRIVGMDTDQGSGWMVVDAFDVMVHVFTRETRANYKLETLWKDATEVTQAALFGLPEPEPVVIAPVKAKRAKAAGKKTVTVKKAVAKTKTSAAKKPAAKAKSAAAAKKAPAKKKGTAKAAKPAARKAVAKKAVVKSAGKAKPVVKKATKVVKAVKPAAKKASAKSKTGKTPKAKR